MFLQCRNLHSHKQGTAKHIFTSRKFSGYTNLQFRTALKRSLTFKGNGDNGAEIRAKSCILSRNIVDKLQSERGSY